MGDTANWEFAAVVAGVTIGLGGLLLFTLIGAFGSWRAYASADRASRETEKASLAMQDLARALAARSERQLPVIELRDAAAEIADLRLQANALIEQQARLQDAVRNLVEAGGPHAEGIDRQYAELEALMRKLEDNLTRIAAAVSNIHHRPS